MKKRLHIVSFLVLLVLLSGDVLADYVFEGWDDGNINGWLPATGAAVLEAHLSDGCVGGYLSSTEAIFTHGIVGAINYGPEYTGDFNAHGYRRVQVAVKIITGSFYSAYFHVRYMDAGHNGWQLPLDVDYGISDWQLFVFDIDPTWTDQDAEAAGWVQESASPSFASTMADVYSLGFKMHSYGAASVGLDHVSLQDLSTPSEEKTWAGVKALYR